MHISTGILLVIALIAGALPAKAGAVEFIVVVGVNAPITSLTMAQVADIFLGRTLALPNGTAIVPVDQVDGSTIRQEFYSKTTGKSPQLLKAHWSKLIFTGQGEPPREVANSESVKKLVASNPSYIGYIERTAVDSTVKTVMTVR